MRILNRVLRIGVLLTALAAVAVLLLAAGGSAALTVDTVIPVIAATGAAGGLVSSVRYGRVRLAVGRDSAAATSIDAATTTWGKLSGMTADAAWSVLVGVIGWIIASIFSGDALGFFVLGSMWLVGFLAVVVAVFLVWMPVAVFVAAVRAKGAGRKARGSWLALAWCLVGLDLFVILMVADAVLVPRGADGQSHPENLWQTILFVGVSGLLVLLSIAWVVFRVGSWNHHVRRRRSAEPSRSDTQTRSRR
ncbi:hypothetical protein LLS1_19350 [Leifsonia sp. LS1]|uniref:hypothetical protein n=1 Tax=Leifsonia sp. LS1 TaxID=2828483 RepID=UPI001CFC4C61|nr:hypothetical protein [Leifsonia sp. LS1]GIT80266.1 hypothetical protein LLS1_19350 [Leifsonia sp. LS1]